MSAALAYNLFARKQISRRARTSVRNIFRASNVISLNMSLTLFAADYSDTFADASSLETTGIPPPKTVAKTSADPSAPGLAASLPHRPKPRRRPERSSRSTARATTPADQTALRFCIVLARADCPAASGKFLLPNVLSPAARQSQFSSPEESRLPAADPRSHRTVRYLHPDESTAKRPPAPRPYRK